MVFRGILMYFLMASHLIFTAMEEMLYVCMATKKQLMNAIIEVLSRTSDPTSTSRINNDVATLLHLPDELLQEKTQFVQAALIAIKCDGQELS